MSLAFADVTLERMGQLFPNHQFSMNSAGIVVRRFGNDKILRRVCLHNRRPQQCNECSAAFVADETINHRGAPEPKDIPKLPSDSDPFLNRNHTEAPIICANIPEDVRLKQMEYIVGRGKRCDNNCIVYEGCCDEVGMGNVRFEGKLYRVSVLAWILQHNRLVPEGFEIRHICSSEDGKCYEFTHLEIGTKRQNMFEDKLRDGTLHFGENHHFAKIDNVKALDIFNSKGNGTRGERAVRFGVTPKCVKNIDTGVSWSHVTGYHRGSTKNRNTAYIRRQTTSRADATRDDYEKAIENIRRHTIINPERPDCIETDYARCVKGYSSVAMCGHFVKIHIVSYEYYNNNCQKIPEGMVVRHTCDNPACHKHEHLIIGTQGDNVQDQYDRGRRNKRARKETEEEEEAEEQEGEDNER